MALRVNELKERLVTERDLTKLWHSFMDMTQDPEFQKLQKRCTDENLVRRMWEIAGVLSRRVPENKIAALILFEIERFDLVHGPVTLTRGLGNLFYFKSIDCGLLAIPNHATTHPSHRVTMVRFSMGRVVDKAAVAATG